jgi:hypothetical protein
MGRAMSTLPPTTIGSAVRKKNQMRTETSV